MNINKPYRPNLKIFIQKVLDETKNITLKKLTSIITIGNINQYSANGWEDIILKSNNKEFNQIKNLLEGIDELKWRNIKFHNCYITQYFINHNPDGIEFNLNFSHVEYET